jgi:hypothetical protein
MAEQPGCYALAAVGLGYPEVADIGPAAAPVPALVVVERLDLGKTRRMTEAATSAVQDARYQGRPADGRGSEAR